jgi:hypothetical protein
MHLPQVYIIGKYTGYIVSHLISEADDKDHQDN